MSSVLGSDVKYLSREAGELSREDAVTALVIGQEVWVAACGALVEGQIATAVNVDAARIPFGVEHKPACFEVDWNWGRNRRIIQRDTAEEALALAERLTLPKDYLLREGNEDARDCTGVLREEAEP